MVERVAKAKKWRFWIDRGGTFTDVIALSPQDKFSMLKLLSEDSAHYDDAALEAINRFCGPEKTENGEPAEIGEVKVGTTLATNALLERKLPPVALITNKGMGDVIDIGFQTRPDLFALNIRKIAPFYERVLEINARIDAKGTVLTPPDDAEIKQGLEELKTAGILSLAIIFLHGDRYPAHEKHVADLARQAGFEHIAVSHEVSPMIKYVPRGHTVLAEASLSPVIKQYTGKLQAELGKARLYFMQSSGGLIKAQAFRGKDAILSGPAGGMAGAVKLSQMAGHNKIVTFDMGGTSTDVAHYNGRFERRWENQIAGLQLSTPMLDIHTVAAGGGSICRFEDGRYQTGPSSAGANPGPACYRKGGPLTLTDCNLLLGRLAPSFFPSLFGPKANQPLDPEASLAQMEKILTRIETETGTKPSIEEAAQGFLDIAITKMALAIRKISLQRGHDIRDHQLVCFGGAGGQHACRIADFLSMRRIVIFPAAGLLSALGIGLADITSLQRRRIDRKLDSKSLKDATQKMQELEVGLKEKNDDEGATDYLTTLFMQYQGLEGVFEVPFNGENSDNISEQCRVLYRQRYGVEPEGHLLKIDSVSVEKITRGFTLEKNLFAPKATIAPVKPEALIPNALEGGNIPLYRHELLPAGHKLEGPVLICEANATTLVEKGWRAEITPEGTLVLTRDQASGEKAEMTEGEKQKPDPIRLEMFHNRFMNIAEEMGVLLRNTARSVNIRERLDFSCAIFDQEGSLVANAPHVPVHLGSMGQSVRSVIRHFEQTMKPGDSFILNSPWEGGTHLPDITVITPCFSKKQTRLFFVAARAHHADVGGISPGSMPAFSRIIGEEGVLIKPARLAEEGVFDEKAFLNLMMNAEYPARNPDENLADIRAQLAANRFGAGELSNLADDFGEEMVTIYMRHIQDNAAGIVKDMLKRMGPGKFSYSFDRGSQISVSITPGEEGGILIDFSGSSAQREDNFNAPSAIIRAATLYVLRTLLKGNIPLNDGFLRPVKFIIPEDSLLSPAFPAAVVAGNVEVSQVITDSLFGAWEVMAASQGTMNNITFGNEHYQYYETLCGGSGAGPNFHGTDAVHTHMTNSRLTDPEILETRYPVRLTHFSIRRESGGKGRFNGGNGVRREICFLEEMDITLLSNRHKILPYGLKGGKPGKPGHAFLRRQDGRIEEIEACAQEKMKKGDAFIIETPGGGGYGKA